MAKYEEIDVEKMELQEWKDYKTTERIMHQIFSAYGAEAQLAKEPTYYPVDASMLVEKGDTIKNYYKIEIKERLTSYPYFDELPLTVQKYCNVIDATPQGQTPLAVYLVNDTEYYIFNLNKIDFNKVKIQNWEINKVQYSNNTYKEKVPTFFIPLSQSIYNGLIPSDNADN